MQNDRKHDGERREFLSRDGGKSRRMTQLPGEARFTPTSESPVLLAKQIQLAKLQRRAKQRGARG